MTVVKTQEHAGCWEAWLEHLPAHATAADTEAEAIGKLVVRFPDQFEARIETKRFTPPPHRGDFD